MQAKNMQVLKMGDQKWIVGLEWETLPGDGLLKEELKEVAERDKTTYGLLVSFNNTYSVGLSFTNPKGYSATQALVSANQASINNTDTINQNLPDWIVIEEIPGTEKYWMGVIKKGLPAPEYDVIYDITEVKDHVIELMYDDTFRIFSKSSEIINVFGTMKNVENKSLSELTVDFREKAKFKKILGISPLVIYAGVGLIIIAGLGYAVFQQIEGRNMAEKAASFQRQKEAEIAQKKMAYENEMKNYQDKKAQLENEAKLRVIHGLSGSPSDILNSWYQAVGNMEVGTHGWKMTDVSCYYNVASQPAQFACDYLFKRTGLSTNRMFLEDFPNAKIDGDNAVFTQNISIDPKHLASPDISVINTLKGANNWNASMLSQLQLLKVVNINYKINDSSEIQYEIPAQPLSPDEKEKGVAPRSPTMASLGVAQGTLQVSGDDFDFVKEFADNVNFYGTGLRKVDFKLSNLGKISWVANFDYFILQGGGIIKSSDSNSLSNSSIENNQANNNAARFQQLAPRQ